MGFFRIGKPKTSDTSTAADTTRSGAPSRHAAHAPGTGTPTGTANQTSVPAPSTTSTAWADAVLTRRFAQVDVAHPLLAELARWARVRLMHEAETFAVPSGAPRTTAATGVLGGNGGNGTPGAFAGIRTASTRTDAPSLPALLSRRPALTTPPEVVQRLSALVTSEDATPGDVARVIQHDTYLTAAVLRIANSPLHAPLVPVETVPRAVMMLGMRQILSLVTAASLMRLMSPRDVTARRTFWRHAACAATAARALAVACGGADPGKAFVAGMLHDIGHLLVMGNLPDVAAQIARRATDNDMPLQAAERDLLGYDHCDIGRRLLTEWRLDEAMADAAGTHHGADALGWPDINLYVHLGDMIAVGLGYHMPGDDLLRQPARHALDRLKLTPAAFSSLVGHVLNDTDAMEQALFGATEV